MPPCNIPSEIAKSLSAASVQARTFPFGWLSAWLSIEWQTALPFGGV